MKKKDKKFILVLLVVIVLDQLTKFTIQKTISLNQSIPVIKNIFYFTYLRNTGASFGMLQNMNLLFIIVSLAVIGFFIHYYKKLPQPKIINAIILGGVVGNLIDRIIFGHVTDFLDFRIWPVFNIADSCISIGVIILIIYSLKEKASS